MGENINSGLRGGKGTVVEKSERGIRFHHPCAFDETYRGCFTVLPEPGGNTVRVVNGSLNYIQQPQQSAGPLQCDLLGKDPDDEEGKKLKLWRCTFSIPAAAGLTPPNGNTVLCAVISMGSTGNYALRSGKRLSVSFGFYSSLPSGSSNRIFLPLASVGKDSSGCRVTQQHSGSLRTFFLLNEENESSSVPEESSSSGSSSSTEPSSQSSESAHGSASESAHDSAAESSASESGSPASESAHGGGHGENSESGGGAGTGSNASESSDQVLESDSPESSDPVLESDSSISEESSSSGSVSDSGSFSGSVSGSVSGDEYWVVDQVIYDGERCTGTLISHEASRMIVKAPFALCTSCYDDNNVFQYSIATVLIAGPYATYSEAEAHRADSAD